MKANLDNLINDIQDILKFKENIETLKTLNNRFLKENTLGMIATTLIFMFIMNGAVFSTVNIVAGLFLAFFSIVGFIVGCIFIKDILAVKCSTSLDEFLLNLLPRDNQYLTYAVSKKLNSDLEHLSYVIPYWDEHKKDINIADLIYDILDYTSSSHIASKSNVIVDIINDLAINSTERGALLSFLREKLESELTTEKQQIREIQKLSSEFEKVEKIKLDLKESLVKTI